MDHRTVAGKALRRPTLDAENPAVTELSLTGRFAYAECQAEDLDQDDAVGTGSLRRVAVSLSSLAKSRLSDLELTDVTLQRVSVANASWEQVVARRVELIRCQAVGFQLGVSKAEDLYFEDCKLDYSRLDIDQRRGAIAFHRCTFTEASIDGDLSGVVFSDCTFTGAEFRVRRAVDCDLTTSRLTGATGLLSLTGARITDDQTMTLARQLATEAGLVVS